MKQRILVSIVLFALSTLFVVVVIAQEDMMDDMMMETVPFVHGFVFNIDGEDYYAAGAPDGPMGEVDVPGHEWIKISDTEYFALHYNTGPDGAAQWWSSDAPDGELLYVANVIIDTWSEEKAAKYAERGYVHYHEFITVADGTLHPDKVGWFQHIALTSFTLDGGPAGDMPYEVTPGIDYGFLPNGMNPYTVEAHD